MQRAVAYHGAMAIARTRGLAAGTRRFVRPRVRVWQVLTVAAVLLGCGLVHVWVRLKVTELGYGLSTAREIVARLEQEQRELEAELAMLTAPQRLADEGWRRLRLQEPNRTTVRSSS